MFRIRACHFIFFLGLSLSGFSQRSVHRYDDAWFKLIFTDQISQKTRWEFIFQDRRQADNDLNILKKQQLLSYWFWIHHNPNKNLRLSVSPLCYFETHFLSNPDKRAIKEWRWCTRAEYLKSFSNFQLMNRAGLEYRWRDLYLKNNYVGNFRARYMLRCVLPLVQINGRPLNFTANDEVMIQFGDGVKRYRSHYDQNRIYAGLIYELVRNIKLEMGYCYVSQLRPSGRDIDVQHAIWCFVTFENIFKRFRKTESHP